MNVQVKAMAKTPQLQAVTLKVLEFLEKQESASRYEKPLSEFLENQKLGRLKQTETVLDENHRVTAVELRFELVDVSTAVQALQKEIEKLQVPCGSEIRFLRNGSMINRRVGSLEVVELTLDFSSLSQDAFEQLDFHAFTNDLKTSLKSSDLGEVRGVWSGPEETGFFLCGLSASKIREALQELRKREEILKNARLTLRTLDERGKVILAKDRLV